MGLKSLFLAVVSFCVMASTNTAVASEFTLVEEPLGCITARVFPCSVRSAANAQSLLTERGHFRFAAGASLQWLSVEAIRILQGAIFVEGIQDLKLHHGTLIFSLRGDVWIEKSADKTLHLKNFDGQIRLTQGPLQNIETIPAGFENWYKGLVSKSQIGQGLIRPIVWASFIKKWVGLVDSPKIVKSKIELYKPRWREAVEESSNLYHQVASRRLASVEEKNERARLARQRAKEEAQLLRIMFRQKNYIE